MKKWLFINTITLLGINTERQALGKRSVVVTLLIASIMVISFLIGFFYRRRKRLRHNQQPAENIYVDPSTLCRHDFHSKCLQQVKNDADAKL